jgi:hypothetical protein
VVFFDEAGLDLHILEGHVALDDSGGGMFPAFYLVQNGLRRRRVL